LPAPARAKSRARQKISKAYAAALRPVGKPMVKPLATKRMTKHVQAVSTGKEIQTATNAFLPVVGAAVKRSSSSDAV